tara:strand:+ start:342 stop:572 length:231 start_codon:yes stop_codon:yes gene_type:complete
MQSLNILLKSIFLLIVFSSKAHAYIDPGIGSIILQGIIASIAAASVFFSGLRNKITGYFIKIKRLIFRAKKNDIKK